MGIRHRRDIVRTLSWFNSSNVTLLHILHFQVITTSNGSFAVLLQLPTTNVLFQLVQFSSHHPQGHDLVQLNCSHSRRQRILNNFPHFIVLNESLLAFGFRKAVSRDAMPVVRANLWVNIRKWNRCRKGSSGGTKRYMVTGLGRSPVDPEGSYLFKIWIYGSYMLFVFERLHRNIFIYQTGTSHFLRSHSRMCSSGKTDNILIYWIDSGSTSHCATEKDQKPFTAPQEAPIGNKFVKQQ